MLAVAPCVPICAALQSRMDKLPVRTYTEQFGANFADEKQTAFDRNRRVEKQAGERNGVAEASPFRFTADGNADRIRVLRLFWLSETIGVVKLPECLLSGLQVTVITDCARK